MSPELRELLDRYLAELPLWKRWLVKGALAIAEPQASPLLGCLVLLVVVAIIFGAVFELGCWLRWWPNLCP